MLKIELVDGLLWLRLNRPGQLNAFNEEMGDALEAAFLEADRDDAVRGVIVTGEGRAFCAGADLTRQGNVFALDETATPDINMLKNRFNDPYVVSRIRDKGGRVALAIDACRKPVVAAINGAAVGVGATLILAMDFRLASTEASFGYVFSRLGVVPEACSTWFLPRIVGPERALEWCLTGDIFKAEVALEAGLVRSLHAPDDLLAAAEAFTRRLFFRKSPAAVALTRQMLRRGPSTNAFEAHILESLAMFELSRTDGREGVAAFLAKREPVFTHTVSDLPASLSPLFSLTD